VAYVLSIVTKIIDLGWSWTTISPNFLGILGYCGFLGCNNG